MSPDRFLNGVLLTAAVLIAAVCGLCTVAVVAASLPPILTKSPDAPYAWMFLVPGLLIGGAGVLLGGVLFHSARAGPRKPDDLDLLASGLTVIGSGFYVLVFTGLTALAASSAWVQASAPDWQGSGVLFSLFWTLAFALAASACVWLARGGLRRYRAAQRSLAEARKTP